MHHFSQYPLKTNIIWLDKLQGSVTWIFRVTEWFQYKDWWSRLEINVKERHDRAGCLIEYLSWNTSLSFEYFTKGCSDVKRVNVLKGNKDQSWTVTCNDKDVLTYEVWKVGGYIKGIIILRFLPFFYSISLYQMLLSPFQMWLWAKRITILTCNGFLRAFFWVRKSGNICIIIELISHFYENVIEIILFFRHR